MLRASTFARRMSRTQRLDWHKAVTIHHDPSVSEDWKQRAAGLLNRRSTAASVPHKIPTIDWESYIAKAEDKESVRKMQREYESHKFPPVEGENLESLKAQCKAWLEVEESCQAKRLEMAEMHKQKMLDCEEEKRTIATWNLKDFYRSIPGLEQEFRDEAMRGEWIYPKDVEKAFESVNVKDLTKLVAEGRASEINLPSVIPKKVGDIDAEEERAKYAGVFEVLQAKFEKLGKLPVA